MFTTLFLFISLLMTPFVLKSMYYLPTPSPLTQEELKKLAPRAALYNAVMQDDSAAIEKILKTMPDCINETNDHFETVLMYAKTRASCEQLLDAGALVEVYDGSGRSPLIHAALMGSVDVIAALLLHNVPLETEDIYGYTALMRAAEQDHFAATFFLIKVGCSLTHTSKHGKRCVDILKEMQTTTPEEQEIHDAIMKEISSAFARLTGK